ncbi:MAG: TraR/DksA C4-type zinc finger protein [Chthoniobacterales bacterium]|nr:TraR/DksA C4-type zinc finger protein [Chthoniobacterales bacterium]
MAASKKTTSSKPAKKTPAAKKPAVAKKTPAKKTSTPKSAANKTAPKKADAPKRTPVAPARKSRATKAQAVGTRELLAYGQPVEKSRRLNPWLKQQHFRLLALKDTLLDTMTGVARDNLRSHDAHEISAHGLHQADAGSDSYDRDFALNLLSQEQDALFEIDEALKRIFRGTYGVCEMSNKAIPKARLEARPFARFTVECQSEIERKNRFSRIRQPVVRLFDTVDEEGSDDSEEESSADSKE